MMHMEDSMPQILRMKWYSSCYIDYNPCLCLTLYSLLCVAFTSNSISLSLVYVVFCTCSKYFTHGILRYCSLSMLLMYDVFASLIADV